MPAVKKMGTPTKADLQFWIDQTRQEKTCYAIHAIMVDFIAVLTAVFLPEILFRTAFNNGAATPFSPDLLSWIPVVSYAVALLFTLYVGIGNLVRGNKLKNLVRMWDTAQK